MNNPFENIIDVIIEENLVDIFEEFDVSEELHEELISELSFSSAKAKQFKKAGFGGGPIGRAKRVGGVTRQTALSGAGAAAKALSKRGIKLTFKNGKLSVAKSQKVTGQRKIADRKRVLARKRGGARKLKLANVKRQATRKANKK